MVSRERELRFPFFIPVKKMKNINFVTDTYDKKSTEKLIYSE